jgi:hypothetical protein
MKKYLLAATILASLAAPALATQKQVGTWVVQTEKDRFGGGDTVIAITIDGQTALGLRCMSGSLSFAHIDPTLNLTPGSPFMVSFKGGNHDVISTFGAAVNDKMIEVVVTNEMRSQLLNSDEFAFRFTSPKLHFDAVWPAGTTKAAPPAVIKACPPKADKDE